MKKGEINVAVAIWYLAKGNASTANGIGRRALHWQFLYQRGKWYGWRQSGHIGWMPKERHEKKCQSVVLSHYYQSHAQNPVSNPLLKAPQLISLHSLVHLSPDAVGGGGHVARVDERPAAEGEGRHGAVRVDLHQGRLPGVLVHARLHAVDDAAAAAGKAAD